MQKSKCYETFNISFQTINVLETATSRRKIVTIGDSSATIEIELWGQQIDVLNFQVDQTVLFTCLTVDVYCTKTSLNTNMSTTLEIQQSIYYWFILSLIDLLNSFVFTRPSCRSNIGNEEGRFRRRSVQKKY